MEEGTTEMKSFEVTTQNYTDMSVQLSNFSGGEDFEFTLDIFSDEFESVAQNSNAHFICSYLGDVADQNYRGGFTVFFGNSMDEFYIREKQDLVAMKIRHIYRRYISEKNRGVLCWETYQILLKKEAREVWSSIGVDDAAEKLSELIYFQITGKSSPPENDTEERWAGIIKKELDGFSFNEVFDRAEEYFVADFSDACDGPNYTSQARMAMSAAYNDMLFVERN